MEMVKGAREKPRSTGNGFFIWSIVLLLMTAACFASWIGSFYVVMHPENPKCYGILKKFKRIDPPRRFPVTEAPKGEFLGPSKLLDRYGKLGPVELARENSLLLSDYLRNYRESRRRVPYVAGRFQVVQSHVLAKADLFPSGAVAVAQAENLPQVLVEFVFPAAPKDVGTIRETVAMGAEITLQRSHDLWALINVNRYEDGRMQFTVVPLPYGGWQLKKGQGSFTLRSPEELLRDYKFDIDLTAGFPIVRDPRLSDALAEYKQFRRKALASAGDDQAALAGPALIRFEPEAAKVEEPGKGLPRQVSSKTGPDSPPGRGSSIVRPMPTPAPAVPLPPRPIVRNKPPAGLIGAGPSTVVPSPPPREAIPAPNDSSPSPGSRALSTAEASALVDKYSGSEPAVLSGDFVVTGVLGRRVALRTRDSLRDPGADPTLPGNGAALIVVDFPEGVVPPEKDAIFSRDAARGFVIRDVIRGRNGQITIVAVERSAE
jgi:hypothetical protein